MAGGQTFRRIYGGLRPWLLEAYLKGLEEGVFLLPGARVRFREPPPQGGRPGGAPAGSRGGRAGSPEKLELYAARCGG
ncbi:MAG: DUF1952 domain-containing protein [Thermaceae bacterium]